jgi:ABC-2 type transport system ATP-binding protein
MAIIEVADLSKTFRQAVKKPGLRGAIQHLFTQQYRDVAAVDQINLRINAGESVAYLGPNGAGKSTTIKMLTGILVPSAGQVRVNGIVPHQHRMENAMGIGVVFGQRTQLWWDLPVRESLALLKDIYEIPTPIYQANLARFVDLLDMDAFMDLSVRKLSLGQRMRADLAAALLHNPRIVYLDEPTIGLDIAVKARIRSFIKQINREQGTTVLLTTHDLGDIEDLCDRLVIIDTGRIIYDGTLAVVKDTFARDRTMHFQVRQPTPALPQALAAQPGLTLEQTDALQFAIRFDRFAIQAGDVIALVMRQSEIVDLRIDEPAIEEIIRRVYDGTLTLSAPNDRVRG